MYLSILEDTGFWLESKVLSVIQDQEEEYLKRHRVVYQQIIQVRLFFYPHLKACLMILERGAGRERDREGNIHRLPLTHAPTWD